MSVVRFCRSGSAIPRYGQLDEPDGKIAILSGPPWLGGEPTDETVALAEVKLLTPCTPGKIVCVGKNYRDHAAEMTQLRGDGGVPAEPLLFLKPPSALTAPGAEIYYPPQSERVDYEGELALVIGRTCRRVSTEAALDHLFGYTIANDVTARDLQGRDKQWTRAKGFDSFCPLGPRIVAELPADASLQTTLNGKLVQSTTIDQMVFSPSILLAYISAVMTLEPGDIVLTGTPAGIGPMQPGDEVRVTIAGIGTLTNTVVKQS
ncbi:fumarylacetoacetate hydrolase family protein [Gloeobacter kilaueensis]|uniref:5-carboxymethyl-2-hydroxymuconate delta-isomerase n=1 Tax=Gloeobacter kilaueensis (strain ATCC BAA-2537 / CCAP 1431/1 / ULC 316 / JS1) TaxID=1183438 RepID=U5QMN5_GLOK1|nr:fumarylacetoacetate hydrolase family protein [Gloeobacter kilaueensis]AGY60186.1 5-carboxymethyl-2-hydroxymuconate delta-isomerase [Gloeobacter kilaueensis JS1]